MEKHEYFSMNNQDQDDDEHRAELSLCWTCRYGMCLQESELERVITPPGVVQQENPFGDEDSDHIMGHLIEHERTKTICWWRPPGVENALPILAAFVKKCSRFDKKS